MVGTMAGTDGTTAAMDGIMAATVGLSSSARRPFTPTIPIIIQAIILITPILITIPGVSLSSAATITTTTGVDRGFLTPGSQFRDNLSGEVRAAAKNSFRKERGGTGHRAVLQAWAV